jgi:hypothetical protein
LILNIKINKRSFISNISNGTLDKNNFFNS